ncbi:uncharacterized protein TRIADDRAFT_32238 [Trichoplax adhaerens]|uniref:Putative 2'-deoxynucleoside 5'-phosphate N-hydrolase 1 n=1 Tax=Trichoplax adhaerens TaxID=10228 RepID=DNPH1_TRIAD|nr:hypothetical protein TRIADDRAFT_32238 [Trichoplax adhaerens]B3SAE4.1 RecName: Full=Putative 2'-deoxynucleoside 5'-phosphate N-hydrolase 1 [Trichoplax adhaerens]EDV20245.1 hypothetical protein TRIADDRAFT_32238 [Trichoplax adhaerens]|eukprot:XP_002117195.1 hypothetical protein TRIADDRAFT_32238 [Trichoplax adhaerens]
MAKRSIYFCGSIRGGRNDAQFYAKIIQHLKQYGDILTEHVGHCGPEEEGLDDKTIHDRDLAWLLQSDVIVAEVTQPSLGVGYELGRAIAADKLVLCLFRPDSGRRLSGMIRGAINSVNFFVEDYHQDEYASKIDQFFTVRVTRP